jgi:CubicO group peptidase (beta-lactamase class C family)
MTMQLDDEQIFMARRRDFLAMAGVASASAFLPAPVWAKSIQRYPTVQTKIDALIAAKKLPGIVAAIGKGVRPPEYMIKGHLAVGNATAVNKDSLFRVYSMTKPVTGIAAMILIGEGKMRLDQPIADFIPEFAQMRVATSPDTSMDSVPAKTQITVRHLLTHTAGLGYTITTKGPLLQAYLDNGLAPAVASRIPLPIAPPSAPVPDLKTFAERTAKLPLMAEPGTKWIYSMSLDILGRVIEVASGMDFGSFLQTRIFDPLKMTSSYFQVPQSEVGRFATNYGVVGGALIPIDPGVNSIYTDKPAFPFGGAGLVSSAHDYDRFLAMLLGGGALDGVRIMSRAAVGVATSNLLPPGTDTKGTFIDGHHFGAGGRVGTGAVAGSFGWSGAAGTVGFIHKKRNIRATGMVQYMPPNAIEFHDDFAKWVMADTSR